MIEARLLRNLIFGQLVARIFGEVMKSFGFACGFDAFYGLLGIRASFGKNAF